jgi:hypothetical protein
MMIHDGLKKLHFDYIIFSFSIVDGRIKVKCIIIYSLKTFFNEKLAQLRCTGIYFDSQFKYFINM